MKISTLASPSHGDMLTDYLVKSLHETKSLPEDDLQIVLADQVAGEKPSFNSPEWSEFMKIKAKVLLEGLLATPENDYFLFLDADIIVVNDFRDYLDKEMKTWDLITQSDSPFPQYPNFCTGIICARNCESVRSLFKVVSMVMEGHKFISNQPSFKNEQEVFTFFAVNRNKFAELKDLKIKTFPFERAFTYGSFAGKVWDGTDRDFKLPPKDKLLWVHANYCHHEKKIELLELFKEKLK